MDFCDFLVLRKHAEPFARDLVARLDGWELPFGFRFADIFFPAQWDPKLGIHVT